MERKRRKEEVSKEIERDLIRTTSLSPTSPCE